MHMKTFIEAILINDQVLSYQNLMLIKHLNHLELASLRVLCNVVFSAARPLLMTARANYLYGFLCLLALPDGSSSVCYCMLLKGSHVEKSVCITLFSLIWLTYLQLLLTFTG